MVDSSILLGIRWKANLTRGMLDAPLISPLFVAEHGPAVQIADIRDASRVTGVLGFIPGSSFPGIAGLEELVRTPDAPPLVLVSATGNASAVIARQLELSGHKRVAALRGGLAAWRALGLATSRDPTATQAGVLGASETSDDTGPLTAELVRTHIGDPRSVRWMKLPSLIAHGRLSCIDGRDERGVIGSPGGDCGEFLLGLAAIEQSTGRELADEEVAAGLLSRLDYFGSFSMHTDVQAFQALMAELAEIPEVRAHTADVAGFEEWIAFLHNAPDELHETLLDQLLKPAHIGCGHIRLMLEHSDQYRIRHGLVVSFLRAFFRLWWECTPEVALTVLPGDHSERAVVNVRLTEEPWELSHIPLISPACAGRQIFVNHPDFSAFLRRQTVRLWAREGGPLGLDASQQCDLQTAIAELAEHQLSVTAGYLAAGLPAFEVVFSPDGSFEVRGSG